MISNKKDQIYTLLKGIETGDPEAVTVVNENKGVCPDRLEWDVIDVKTILPYLFIDINLIFLYQVPTRLITRPCPAALDLIPVMFRFDHTQKTYKKRSILEL